MANFCPNCGKPMSATLKFCPYCGTGLSQTMGVNPDNLNLEKASNAARPGFDTGEPLPDKSGGKMPEIKRQLKNPTPY